MSGAAYESTLLPRVRKFSLALAIIVLGLGLYSHYASSWVKKIHPPHTPFPFYEICNSYILHVLTEDRIHFSQGCPGIGMERYFVAAIITCFILSVAFFAASLSTSKKMQKLMHFDIAYHVLGGIAIIAAGAVYLSAAIQLERFIDALNHSKWASLGIYESFEFRYTEKRVAAGFAILNGIFMLILARYIHRYQPRDSKTSAIHTVVAQPVVAQSNFGYPSQPYPQQQNLAYNNPPPPYSPSVDYGASQPSAPPPPPYTLNKNYGLASLPVQPSPAPASAAIGFIYTNQNT